jgi:lysylphosphatidylglycerol synthetase-like protein (DUF2156 family)
MVLFACAACTPDFSEPIIWLAAVITAFVLSLRTYTRVESHRAAAGEIPACPHCRYALQGLSPQGLCPECGISYDIDTPTRLRRVFKCQGFGCQLAAIAVAYSCFHLYALAAQSGYQVLRGWTAEDAAYQVLRDTWYASRAPPFWYNPLVWYIFAAVMVVAAPFLSMRRRWAMLFAGTLTGTLACWLAITIAWTTASVLQPGWNGLELLTTLPAMILGTSAGFFLTKRTTKTPQCSSSTQP